MTEKLVIALVSAMAGGLISYGAKALTLEGRLDAIEHTVARIENRLFPVAHTAAKQEEAR